MTMRSREPLKPRCGGCGSHLKLNSNDRAWDGIDLWLSGTYPDRALCHGGKRHQPEPELVTYIREEARC